MSWLVVLVGAVAFGGGIAGLARVLPSDDVPRGRASYGAGSDAAPPVAVAHAPGEGAAAAPGASGPQRASGPEKAIESQAIALDFRPLDLTRRDRYGNPPKRDATPDELAAIAAAHDIVVDDLRWQPDGAAFDASQIASMKATNPRLRVLRYVGALTNNDGPIFGVAPDDGVHGPWFLRDGSGEFVHAYQDIAAWNGRPSYAFDPASADVRNDIGVRTRQFARLGYDGVLLDGVAACVPAPLTPCGDAVLLSHPINKATNRTYTDADWIADARGLLRAVRQIAPDAQIFLRASGDLSALLPYVAGTLMLRP